MGLPHLSPQDVTRDAHRCWRSCGISCGKTEQIDRDIFRVPQWQRLFDDLRKDGIQALHEEGTDGIKIRIFFESSRITEEGPLHLRTIKGVFPCRSTEHLSETLRPRFFWRTMPRQESVDRLPKWEQEPQVNGVSLCDGFNGRPFHFHPIGIQEHHCTMGTPVSLTTPLLETSIGVIMN